MGKADEARLRLSADLERVAGGDRDAMGRVYLETSAKLFGVCLRFAGEREAAEDLLQDVYIKVWHRAGSFEPTRASPITWLCTIARNTSIDWHRASGRVRTEAPIVFEELPDEGLTADAAIERDEQHQMLVECLDLLETRQATAIRAAFFEGRTYVQLAEHQNVPLGTMKSWIRRGLERLRGCLDNG